MQEDRQNIQRVERGGGDRKGTLVQFVLVQGWFAVVVVLGGRGCTVHCLMGVCVLSPYNFLNVTGA